MWGQEEPYKLADQDRELRGKRRKRRAGALQDKSQLELCRRVGQTGTAYQRAILLGWEWHLRQVCWRRQSWTKIVKNSLCLGRGFSRSKGKTNMADDQNLLRKEREQHSEETKDEQVFENTVHKQGIMILGNSQVPWRALRSTKIRCPWN